MRTYTLKRKDRIAAFGRDVLAIQWQAMKDCLNVAPSQVMPIAILGADQKPEAIELPWKAPPNARVESLTSELKPMWSEAVQSRRCLVPADGFYKRKKITEKIKEPFHSPLKEGAPFFFAGIFGREFVVITTAPNEVLLPVHDRMPVILTAETALQWLRPGEMGAEEIVRIAGPLFIRNCYKLRQFKIALFAELYQ